MADASRIEWTDATWNPVTGCSIVSPGCTNCYAMKLAGTRLRHHPSRAGLTRDTKAGPVWTGEVRFNAQWLDQPLKWRRPRKIFVCAHGDLFHEDVPDEWIDRVFAVMALAPQHIFQVLTKRAERMREYLRADGIRDEIWSRAKAIPTTTAFPRAWPLPNVWLGTSVEDQTRADERIPDLLATPAAVRFLSCEPLLGPVTLDMRPWGKAGWWNYLSGSRGTGPAGWHGAAIDWVICGGESGPGARPMEEAWAESLRDQCRGAGVAFFMKQMAKKAPIPPRLLIRQFPEALASEKGRDRG